MELMNANFLSRHSTYGDGAHKPCMLPSLSTRQSSWSRRRVAAGQLRVIVPALLPDLTHIHQQLEDGGEN